MICKLSIIIPAFNPPTTFFKNIVKIINKKINSNYYEIIIIDDYSNKKIFDKLRKYKNNIVFLRNKKNLGPGLSRNLGIRKSTGSHLMFLDSDDFISKNSISLIIKTIKKVNVNVIFFNHILQEKDKKIKFNHKDKYIDSKTKILYNFLSSSTDTSAIFSIFNKKFILKNKIFFKSGLHEDILFMFKVFFCLKNKYFLNKYVYIKKNNPNSIINNISKKRINDYFKALNSIYNFYKKNLNSKKNVKLKEIYYKGQVGYVFQMINYLMNKEKNLLKSFNLMQYIFIVVKKRFHIMNFPCKTRQDKVVNYYINNINQLNSKNDYLYFIKNIRKI